MSAAELDELDLPLLHTRTYEVRSYRQSDSEFRLRGRVTDVKPPGNFIAEDPEPMTIHDMVVDIVVEMPAMVITAAEVVMATHPHHHCPSVVEHYQKLIGLSIARGYTHRVRELFGGPNGCTHTTALLVAMAPVAHQSMWSMMRPVEGEAPVEITLEVQRERMVWNKNTCHVWAEDGPMFASLERGEMIPPPKWGVERLEQLGLSVEDWYRRGAR